MEMKVMINFHYHGDWSGLRKACVERSFLALYNPWTELINPHYEEWNEEWRKLYPEADIDPNGGNEWFFKYNAFIAEKARPLEDKNNEKLLKNGHWYNKLFEVHTDPEYGSARFIDRSNRSRYMTFDMTCI